METRMTPPSHLTSCPPPLNKKRTAFASPSFDLLEEALVIFALVVTAGHGHLAHVDECLAGVHVVGA